jgi:hypothetical protein
MNGIFGFKSSIYFVMKFDFPLFSFLFSVLFQSSHHFCSLLLRRECCTFSNGEYMKSGLSELEKWIANAKEMVTELANISSRFFRFICFMGLTKYL